MKLIRNITFIITLILIPALLPAQTDTQVLTLDDCIRIALENNQNLNMADINNQIAEKTYLQSYSDILPQVNVGYSGNKYNQGVSSVYVNGVFVGTAPGGTGRNYSAQIRASQNIFDGGRWWLNIKKSKLDRISSNYSYLSSRQNIIVTVRQFYLDLLKQEKLLDVNQQAVSRSEDQLNRVRSMYEVGSVAQIDVFRSEVNLGNDRISFLNQQNTVKEARRSLNIALGRDPETPIEIDKNIKFEKEVGNLDDMIQQALSKNPDIKAGEVNVRSAKYGIRLAQSTFLPNLSAFYSYSRTVPRFNRLYENFDRDYSWYVGLNLSWNLFNGFSDFLGVQKARLNSRYTSEQLANNRLNLRSQVSSLYNNLVALNEIIKINQTNLASAQEDYRLAQERYRLGSGTLLDLRDAQVNLATAEQILVSAEFNSYITYAEIQQALGELVDY